MNKLNKMNATERLELERADAKAKMHCRDYFGGFLKRTEFLRTMRDFPYTDPALAPSYVVNSLYPTIPGTLNGVLDWAIGCGYIEQEDYDDILKGIENGIG